jgi:hypothetical protein
VDVAWVAKFALLPIIPLLAAIAPITSKAHRAVAKRITSVLTFRSEAKVAVALCCCVALAMAVARVTIYACKTVVPPIARAKDVLAEQQQYNNEHEVPPAEQQHTADYTSRGADDAGLPSIGGFLNISDHGQRTKEEQESERRDRVAHFEWTHVLYVCRLFDGALHQCSQCVA